jgi:hypothetical protein
MVLFVLMDREVTNLSQLKVCRSNVSDSVNREAPNEREDEIHVWCERNKSKLMSQDQPIIQDGHPEALCGEMSRDGMPPRGR